MAVSIHAKTALQRDQSFCPWCKFIQEAGLRASHHHPPFLHTIFREAAWHFHYGQAGRGQDIRHIKLCGSVQWCRISRGMLLSGWVDSVFTSGFLPCDMSGFTFWRIKRGKNTLILTRWPLCLTTTCYFHIHDAFLLMISPRSHSHY